MSLGSPTYLPVTLFFWDGTQQIKIVYNGVANSFHPGYIWPLGWWGVLTPERGTHGVYALRSAGGANAVEAYARIDDDTAVRGTHYEFQNVPTPLGLPASDRYIKFSWNVGEIGVKATPVQIFNVDADVRFQVTFVGTRPTGGIVGQRESPPFVNTVLTYIPNNYYVTLAQRPDEHGVVGFVQTEFEFDENQVITIPVYRQAGAVGAVSVDYHTDNGTGGTDYESASGTLNWADDEFGPKYITVNLNDVTSDKTFLIILDNPLGGVYLNPLGSVATVTIADVSGAGRIQFDSIQYQGEAGITIDVIVKRIGGKTGEVSVTFDLDDGTAQGGTHYTDVTDTVTFPDNDNAPVTVEVDLTDDGDTPLVFTARIHTPTGGATLGADQATIIILPTNAPEVPIIQDLLEGSFNPYSRQDEIIDTGSYTRRDTLVNVLQQTVGTGGDEIGWASGGTIYGGNTDYQTPGTFSNNTWRQKHRMTVQQIML